MKKVFCSPGVYLSLIIALFSLLLSGIHPSFDALIVSIIFGMLLSNGLADRKPLENGLAVILKYFLPLGIALYGTQLNFGNGVPTGTWLSVIGVFTLAFFLTFLIAKAFGLSGKLPLLLASGFAVCGASAIAVVAPLSRAGKGETSVSLITIMMVGLVSVIFYPLLSDVAGLTEREFAFISGTTIPMLGQVKVAALEVIGEEGAALAMKFKLVRISMLLFLAAGIIIMSGKERRGIYVPWFMVAFVCLSVIVNVTGSMAPLSIALEPASKFFLSCGLAAIGLSVDFDSVTSEGARPLIAVFVSWAVVLLLLYSALRFFSV